MSNPEKTRQFECADLLALLREIVAECRREYRKLPPLSTALL